MVLVTRHTCHFKGERGLIFENPFSSYQSWMCHANKDLVEKLLIFVRVVLFFNVCYVDLQENVCEVNNRHGGKSAKDRGYRIGLVIFAYAKKTVLFLE